MRIGIVGHEGRLGSQLIKMGCEHIPVWLRRGMPEINFPTEDALIINCAAMTDVDRCEIDEQYYDEAMSTNTFGVKYLAEAYRGEIIHISTDYVFAGKYGAYKEILVSNMHRGDEPTKKMAYALTKLGGEIVAEVFPNVKIVRTTGLYGGNGNDFVKMILKSYAHDTPVIYATGDLHGNQTYIPHLAEALIQYAEIWEKPKVLHIASKDVITRYKFALMICSVFGFDKNKIKACKSSEIPGWVAERPKKGGLKVGLAQKLGLPIYTTLEGLEALKEANG